MIVLVYFIILFLLLFPLIIYISFLFLSNDSKEYERDNPNNHNRISVIITCYNEEKTIEDKTNELIRECEISEIGDYEILIISDGSNDETNNILEKLSFKKEVKVFYLPVRKGKANAINYALKYVKHPVIVFSDSRQKISTGAIKKLLKHFSNSYTGAVSCKLVNTQKHSIIRVSLNKIKELESKKGSTIGVYGPLYAARRDFITKLPYKIILDDLYISLNILQQRKTIVFEPSAIVYDIEFNKLYNNSRILRISYGLIQILYNNFSLIRKLPLKYIVFLIGQKYLKLVTPFCILLLTILSFFNSTILLWHLIGITVVIIISAIIDIMTLRILVRSMVVSIINLLRFKKYKSILWEKTINTSTIQ